MPDFKYELTEAHRNLLQYIIARAFVSKQKLQTKFNQIQQLYESRMHQTRDRSLDDFITSLNDSLATMKMKISVHIFQKTNEWYYSISNEIGDDEMAKFATTYTPHEIAFFKRLLARIADLDADGEQLPVMDAVNLRPKELKLEVADKCIDRLIKDGWLWENTKQGNRKIWFGIRTCHDLRQYLDQELSVTLP